MSTTNTNNNSSGTMEAQSDYLQASVAQRNEAMRIFVREGIKGGLAMGALGGAALFAGIKASPRFAARVASPSAKTFLITGACGPGRAGGRRDPRGVWPRRRRCAAVGGGVRCRC